MGGLHATSCPSVKWARARPRIMPVPSSGSRNLVSRTPCRCSRRCFRVRFTAGRAASLCRRRRSVGGAVCHYEDLAGVSVSRQRYLLQPTSLRGRRVPTHAAQGRSRSPSGGPCPLPSKWTPATKNRLPGNSGFLRAARVDCKHRLLQTVGAPPTQPESANSAPPIATGRPVKLLGKAPATRGQA
jgi:hypothetical protein